MAGLTRLILLSIPFFFHSVPFHKLSQWLTYSLLEPIEKILGWKIEGRDDQTGELLLSRSSSFSTRLTLLLLPPSLSPGLPEYRNG